jgi:hypothetical protein
MKVRTRLSLTALATAAALGTTAAIALPAASAHPLKPVHLHTLGFTSVEQAQVTFSPTLSIAEDRDVNHAGKVVGYDTIRFTFDPKTQTAVIGVTVNLKGGFLYGQLHEGSSSVSHGTVSGGSGAYRGATGTITAKALDQNDDRTAVTITYRTAG